MAEMLKFFAKDKRVNSGVARGVGRPASGVTVLFFFSFETENPLMSWQRPFFFFWSSHTFGLKTEHQLVLQRRPFFFWSSPIFWPIKGATTKSRPCATISSDASEGEKCLKIKLKEIVKFST